MMGSRRWNLVVVLVLSCRICAENSVCAFVATQQHCKRQRGLQVTQTTNPSPTRTQQSRSKTATRWLSQTDCTTTSLAASYDPASFDAGVLLQNLADTTPRDGFTSVDSSSCLVVAQHGLDSLTQALTVTPEQAETLAGPLFGASLFPYLAFLYFLSRPAVDCPKGVTVGFATCLLFVFLTIPAAIAAKLLYGVSLADSDWLHGSAESLLTLTNLVTVLAFRQALQAKEEQNDQMPPSALSYTPMVLLVVVGTLLAGVTAAVPALAADTAVHTSYLYGFMDLPHQPFDTLGPHAQPVNALSIPCWIIHISSLVEFLVAMGFCWRWADITQQPQWKGLTWGLLPLHSSGITACTYHLFYNQIAVLVPLQAFLTCVGNATAAFAAWRIARAAGWSFGRNDDTNGDETQGQVLKTAPLTTNSIQDDVVQASSLIGFEDLGEALAGDNDYSFLTKLFVGSAVASYVIKYGEVWFDFPFDANVYTGMAVILVPSCLNAYKWSQRSKDPSFEGWF